MNEILSTARTCIISENALSVLGNTVYVTFVQPACYLGFVEIVIYKKLEDGAIQFI